MWWTRVLGCGDRGPDVSIVQLKLGLVDSGDFDLGTALAVRGLQSAMGLEASGFVDELTAQAIGPRATDEFAPAWYEGEPLFPGDQRYELVLGDRDEWWLRRFQGNHGLRPTGVIDDTTARLLGALASPE